MLSECLRDTELTSTGHRGSWAFGKVTPEGLIFRSQRALRVRSRSTASLSRPGLLQVCLQSFRGTEGFLAIIIPIGGIKIELGNVHVLYNPSTREVEAGE